MRLILDSGGLSALARRDREASAVIRDYQRDGLWPPVLPTVVIVESITGNGIRDANVNRFIKGCDIVDGVPQALARRAAQLRTWARRGSAVDALVVALAEPGGTVLTADFGDLAALAANADSVAVEPV
jgi:hypothetical protein